MSDEKKVKEIQINFPPELQKGVYANNMVVSHSQEEFMLDFMLISPPNGVVTSRVIMSPGHVKRVIQALIDNLAKYEEKHGPLKAAIEPHNPFGYEA